MSNMWRDSDVISASMQNARLQLHLLWTMLARSRGTTLSSHQNTSTPTRYTTRTLSMVDVYFSFSMVSVWMLRVSPRRRFHTDRQQRWHGMLTHTQTNTICVHVIKTWRNTDTWHALNTRVAPKYLRSDVTIQLLRNACMCWVSMCNGVVSCCGVWSFGACHLTKTHFTILGK